MSLYLSPAQGAKELINKLHHELDALAWLLDASTGLRIDALYEIPLRKCSTVTKSKPIRITPLDLNGDEARQLCKEAMTSIWLRGNQSPKETVRAPGAVAVPEAVLQQINVTNAIRMELFGLISQLDQPGRMAIWRSFPAISSLQALRVTPILSDPLTLRFYWDTGSSMQRRQVKELIESYDKTLAEAHGYRPTLGSLPDDSVDRKLVYALDLLEKLPPDEQVAIYRPVTPHVRARVRDGELPGYICSAPTPFVYSSDCSPPRIKPLHDYEPNVKAGKRSIRAQLMEEPYIDAMNIFRYLEGHRHYGPVKAPERVRNKRNALVAEKAL